MARRLLAEHLYMRAAALAREVIEAAKARKKALVYGYNMEVVRDPSLRFFYNQRLKGWERA
jgi:hypothetical protein